MKTKLRVLIACEYSGASRRAWEKLGHDVVSCDLLPADDGASNHYQGSVFDLIRPQQQASKRHGFDLMIGHPPCTYLTNAGVRWLHSDPTRWAKMVDGAEFFKALADAPIPYIALENPIMHKYAAEIIGRRQDQVIQPWMFGHMEKKGTGLWLKNLPKLVPTTNLKAETDALPMKEQQRIFFASPGADRWKLRSTTFQGIADAMAEQWSAHILNQINQKEAA